MPFGFSPIARNTSTDARIRRAGASTLGSFDMPIDVKLYGGQEFRVIRANAPNPLVETEAYAGGGGEFYVNGWLRLDNERSVAGVGCGILFDDPDPAATQALISFDAAYDVGGLLLSPDVLDVGGKVRVHGNMWFHSDKKLDFGTILACSIFTDGTGDLILDTSTELAGRNIVLRGPVVLEDDLDIKTTKSITFLTAASADGASLSYGDTTGLIVNPTIVGGGVMSVLGDIKLNDSVKLGLGTGSTNTNFDAAIYYDGTNLVLDPDVIGSGVVRILGGARISSSSAMTFGTTDNGTIVYNGTDLVIDPDALGVGVLRIGGHLYLDDNKQVTLGTGQDALLYYDGTDLVVNPKSVGTGRVDVVGNLKCDQVWLLDNEKVVLGTGSDVELYYDGTDVKIVTDVVAASDLVVDCGTDKTIELTETVWDEIRVPWNSTYFDSTLVNPWSAFIIGSIPLLWFGPSVDLSTAFVVNLPHNWKEGTNLHPHIHWSPLLSSDGNPANQVVKWGLEYSWANKGTDLPASTTEFITVHSPADANIVTGRLYTTTFSAIVPGANSDEIDSMLVGRVVRFGTDVGDTYESYAGLISLDFDYEIDTIGSRTQTAK